MRTITRITMTNKHIDTLFDAYKRLPCWESLFDLLCADEFPDYFDALDIEERNCYRGDYWCQVEAFVAMAWGYC